MVVMMMLYLLSLTNFLLYFLLVRNSYQLVLRNGEQRVECFYHFSKLRIYKLPESCAHCFSTSYQMIFLPLKHLQLIRRKKKNTVPVFSAF